MVKDLKAKAFATRELKFFRSARRAWGEALGMTGQTSKKTKNKRFKDPRLPEKIAFWLILSLFVFSLGSGEGAVAKVNLRAATEQGIPLDEAITVRIHGVILKVPAGYLWPWPDKAMRGKINVWDNLAFDFWMPDGRHLETNPIGYAGFTPKEPGRGIPTVDNYVVNVRTMQPVKLGQHGYISPEIGFSNLTSVSGLASYSQEREQFGLVRFWQHDWPYPKPEPFIRYRHVDGMDPQILLHCTQPDKSIVYPSCSGIVHFAAINVGFFVAFPKSKLPEWREIVTKARSLFELWSAHK